MADGEARPAAALSRHRLPSGAAPTRAVLYAGAALWGAACAGEAPAASFATRDSAGIAIAESRAPRWSEGEGWRVEAAPVLDLTTSGSGGVHQFYDVSDATVLPDGAIAVASDGAHRVRFYDGRGAFLDEVGSEGDAPGEFRRLESVHAFRGDSAVAYDFWLGRMSVLGPDREVARVMPRFDPNLRIRRLKKLGEASFLGVTYDLRGLAGLEPGLSRMPWTILAISPGGDVVDTLFTLAGSESFLFGDGDSARPLFPKQTFVATGHGRIVVGTAERLEYRVYTSDGALERIVRVPGLDLSVEPAEVEAARAAYFPPEIEVPPSIAANLAALPVPATRPAYAELLIDATGAVWASVYRSPAEEPGPSAWRVFSAEGEWLGAVQLPANFTTFEIGDAYVLGVSRDDLDVEHVQMLRLVR